MEKVAIVNLGCPKNQVDAETMAGLLAQNGYQLSSQPQGAEIIVVNTCSFIASARQESIDCILAMVELKSRGRCRRLLVTGCLAQAHHRELAKEIPEIDGFLGTGNLDKIAELVKGGVGGVLPPEAYDGRAEERRLYSTYPYSYLKIAEGCNHRCSYCLIPGLRGRLRSKSRRQVLSEARLLGASGRKEAIIIAQDTTQYGLDFAGRSLLPNLLAELETVPGIGWLRLLYCYPENITGELIEAFAASSKLCRYLDVPFQHIHPAILRSMGRKPTGGRELVEKLRRLLPGVALRTTMIVGYPGETDEHYQSLLEFVRWAKFDHLGAFMYSREKGTRAAALQPQVPQSVKKQRFRQLMELQKEIVADHNRRLLGETFTVLVDSVAGGRAYGRSYREAPEIDSKIVFPAARLQTGDFAKIKLTGSWGYDLLGEIIDE